MRTLGLILIAAALSSCLSTGRDPEEMACQMRCNNGIWVYHRYFADRAHCEQVALTFNDKCECISEDEDESSFYRK